MSNVQPGDLARVVAPYITEGRGAFVKVLEVFKEEGGWVCDVRYSPRKPGLRIGWLCEGWVRNFGSAD